jgi:glucosamine-phosphate N-acetyltransferase
MLLRRYGIRLPFAFTPNQPPFQSHPLCVYSTKKPTNTPPKQWNARYEWLSQHNDQYFLLSILDPAHKIVGTGALIVERKFIHNLGLVGHIEDIAVSKDQQGKKLGLRIIQALDYVAEKVGCYKSILDCSEANEGFYVKCGFKRAGLEMAHYYGR